VPPLPVARFLPDCVPADLDAPAVPAVPVPVVVPVDRFTSAVAPARALAELSRDPCPVVPPVPATREEVAVPVARVVGSTLLNVPFEFLKELEKWWPW
jgi:hypothetical protein